MRRSRRGFDHPVPHRVSSNRRRLSARDGIQDRAKRKHRQGREGASEDPKHREPVSRNAGPRACEFILAIGLSSVCSRLSEISSSFARKSPTRASRVIGAIVVAAVLAAVERAYCPVLEIGHFRWHSGLPTLSGGGVLDGAPRSDRGRPRPQRVKLRIA